MNNHLFIGLGGQGGRSLAELRKVMAQRENDVKMLDDRGIKRDFLSIDSSSDVWNAKKEWTYFGKDLSLRDLDRLALTRLNAKEGWGALALKRDIAPWIGKSNVIESYLKANAEIEGANQRRRFGRLLFFNSAISIRKALFTQKVAELTKSAQNECCFHIFASLGGGTGSGGILDLVSMIRSRHSNSDSGHGFPVFLYLFVTSDDGSAADVGYFYENQFATLRDLNALMCSRLKPNIPGEQGQTFQATDPINGISIFTNLNSRNNQLALSTQIRIAAESCFERIYASATGSLSPQSQKCLTGEDILANFPGEPLKQSERSYRFGSMGMRRWEVPNSKLEELLALDLLCSSLRQMRFNNWQADSGYAAELRTLPSEVARANLDLLEKLIDQRLLSKTAFHVLVKEIGDEFTKICRGVKSASGQDGTLEALEVKARDFFERVFQGRGIKSYFENFHIRRETTIRELLMEIDQSLTGGWLDRATPIALAQIPDLLNTLSATLVSLISAAKSNGTVANKVNVLALRRLEEKKLTKLSTLVGKRADLLDAHCRDLTIECVADIKSRCEQLDQSFLRDCVGALTSLKGAYMSALEVIERIQTTCDHDRTAILSDLGEMQAVDSSNKYEFDAKALDSFLQVMRTQYDHQEDTSFAMRNVTAGASNGRTLSRFRGKEAMEADLLDDRLREDAIGRGRQIHRDLEIKGAAPKILGDSLMDRLQTRFAGDDNLLTIECREFVSKAASCFLVNNDLQPRDLGMGTKADMPNRAFILGVPKHPYSNVIRSKFKEVQPAGLPASHLYDVYEHDDPTQLRLLVIDYWMAARFAKVVKELSVIYDSASAEIDGNDVSYFCNIDSEGEVGKRPEILLPDPKIWKERMEAELWVGSQEPLKIIQKNESGAVYLVTETPSGREVILLGDSEKTVIESADLGVMFSIHGAIVAKLAGLPEEKRDTLKEVILGEESRLFAKEGPTSKSFQHWTKLRKQLNPLLD